ncbi:hypothetical protein F0U63_47660 [Cystobacter fuscus]|nr:hypothetical protein F0U63_47660 [Cystobacter fuscus]
MPIARPPRSLCPPDRLHSRGTPGRSSASRREDTGGRASRAAGRSRGDRSGFRGARSLRARSLP